MIIRVGDTNSSLSKKGPRVAPTRATWAATNTPPPPPPSSPPQAVPPPERVTGSPCGLLGRRWWGYSGEVPRGGAKEDGSQCGGGNSRWPR
uniref:Uncharacterized protein n=1 Tax=Arundo donax TaxID=35708 RepID=A0A0A8YHN0_ARUDO